MNFSCHSPLRPSSKAFGPAVADQTGGNSLRAYRFERRVLAESKSSAESSETAFPDIESEILLGCRRTSFFSHLRIRRSGIVNVSEGNHGLTLTTNFSRYSFGGIPLHSGVCDHTNRLPWRCGVWGKLDFGTDRW